MLGNFILCLSCILVLTGCLGSKSGNSSAGNIPEEIEESSISPADIGFSTPNPEPSLPSGVDIFAPPSLAVSPGAPMIAEITKAGKADQVISMTGVDLDGATQLKVFAQKANKKSSLVSVASLKADATAATFLLPATLPSYSMYLVWPERNGIRGKPFAINRTEGWWVGPNKAIVGNEISIYGRNLSKDGGTMSSIVYLKASNGTGQFLTPTAVNPYKVSFIVPSVSAADYEVWIHNGHGGRFGWSGPLTLKVLAQSPWAGQNSQVFNVKNYGAVGDGSTNDLTAIRNAIAAAQAAAPSTVYFPAGLYLINNTLQAPASVRWLGDGMNHSEIRLTATLVSSLITSIGNNAQFENITINGNERITNRALIWVGGSENFKMKSTRVKAWKAYAVEMNGAHNIHIDSSELIEQGSFFGSSTQVFLTNNRFLMTDYGEAATTLWGGHDFSMTGNELINADESISEGHGIGRFFVAQGHFGSMKHMYWGNNRSYNAAPHDCNVVDCNKGEQICFEMFSTWRAQLGTFVGTTANTTTFSAYPATNVDGGVHLAIIGGRGAGQYRHVKSVSGNTATLERPWNVLPDSTSKFTLNATAEKAVVYNNIFEGRADYSTHDSDSTAVLLYGNVTDMVVDRNTISQMRHGMMTVALNAPDGFSPYFLEYSNNTVSNSNSALYVGTTFTTASEAGVWGGLGNVYRNNTFTNIAHIGVEYELWSYLGADYNGTVFDRNSITNVRYAFINAYQLMWTYDGNFRTPPASSSRMYNTILYRNTFQRGTASLSGSVGFKTLQPDNTWLNIGSTWSGFNMGNTGP